MWRDWLRKHPTLALLLACTLAMVGCSYWNDPARQAKRLYNANQSAFERIPPTLLACKRAIHFVASLALDYRNIPCERAGDEALDAAHVQSADLVYSRSTEVQSFIVGVEKMDPRLLKPGWDYKYKTNITLLSGATGECGSEMLSISFFCRRYEIDWCPTLKDCGIVGPGGDGRGRRWFRLSEHNDHWWFFEHAE